MSDGTQRTLQAVVVIYRCQPHESLALRGLLSAIHANPTFAASVRVLIYDNSPQAADVPPLQAEYVHDANNGGLLAAYTRALHQAESNGCDWLLLLDQDTQVTPEFLQMQLQMADALAARPDVAACVPKLRSEGRLVSPHGPLGLRQKPLADGFTGETPPGTTAFNSGAMIRRAALQAIGGFPAGYWLDFLDHATFARLARAGYRTWVLSAVLEHAMTWEDPAKHMSIERFENVLQAELRFHKEYGNAASQLAFRAKCLRRWWQYRSWSDTRYAEVCWRTVLS